MFTRGVIWIAATLGAAVSTHAYARDLRPCLALPDPDQRIECFEGRAQPPQPQKTPTPGTPSFSTSFDCDKASSRVEIAICSDSTLADLDSQMGQTYLRALKSQGDSGTLKNDQRRWLTFRDSKCGFGSDAVIRSCLIPTITGRIAGLAAVAAVPATPSADKSSTFELSSPVPNDAIVGTAAPTAKITPDMAPLPSNPADVPKEKEPPNSRNDSGEAVASKVMIESVRSLLTNSPTPNVKFFTYNVDKKELQGFKSDMPVLRVVYEERVFFDTDKADLLPGALPVVKSVSNTLKRQKQKIALFVAGHTDARGSDEYNLKLSIRRAEAVARALKRDGAGTTVIWRVGFGKSLPIRPNDSEKNMGLNRRVEFLIASEAEVIATWIKTTKFCEDDACGTTSVASKFEAAPISDPGAKPIDIEISNLKPTEIEMVFHQVEVGPPLQ